jgi:hypothetical protein
MKENPLVYEVVDDDLNKIITYHYTNKVDVFLKLKKESKRRKAGTINKKTETILIKRIRNRHTFNQTLSFGFNDYILKNTELFKKIWLKDDWGDEWLIPVEFILENGHYRCFQDAGFEKQIFVRIFDFQQFKFKESGKPLK